jgi:hypothetical protein
MNIVEPTIAMLILAITVGWYVFIPYMLWMIWQKVRHLPG